MLAEAATRFDVVPIYSSSSQDEEDRRGHNGGPSLDDSTAINSNGQPPGGSGFKGFLIAVAAWMTARKFRVDKDQYTGADGIDTAVGIKLDPRVGEPAAGRDYLPDNENHLKGLRGEYGLANEIARQFSDHTVIDFGRRRASEGQT